MRLHLGLGRHPLELVDADLERGEQVPDQRVHARLRFRLEMLLDVELSDRLAERLFDLADAALPPRRLLLASGQHLAVEFELASPRTAPTGRRRTR